MKITVSGSGQLTQHFKLSEFCHKNSEIYIDYRFVVFVQLLEQFRVWYNRPININSGYRPAAYNRQVGGSVNSSHLFSGAVDFNLPAEYYGYNRARKEQFLQNIKTKWCALCQTAGVFPQVNFYDTYIHLGISTKNSSFLDKRTKK